MVRPGRGRTPPEVGLAELCMDRKAARAALDRREPPRRQPAQHHARAHPSLQRQVRLLQPLEGAEADRAGDRGLRLDHRAVQALLGDHLRRRALHASRRARVIKAVIDAPGWRYTSIITNGWFLSEDRAQKLMDTGISQINVSLNYPDARQDDDRKLPGLFKKISHIVPWMAARGANVQLNTHHHERQPRRDRADRAPRARWGGSVMYTLYSELPADNHGHLFPIERQARLFEVIAELRRSSARCRTSSRNTELVLRHDPHLRQGDSHRRLHRRQEDAAHLTGRHGPRVRRAADDGALLGVRSPRGGARHLHRCFQACRGEVQAPITVGRVVEMLRS